MLYDWRVLSNAKILTLVSGVPPDAFSDTGQLWGSPLYDWRVRSERALCDITSSISGFQRFRRWV